MTAKTIIIAGLFLAKANSTNLFEPDQIDFETLISSVTDEHYEARTHDNYAYFIGADIDYEMDMYDVTEGQPFDHVSFEGNTLDVVAGRKKSNIVASVMSNGLGVTNFIGLKSTFQSIPSELNFAIFGTMTFTLPSGKVVECPDFRIGQGNHQHTNNWWIGSTDCVQAPTTGQMTCCCGNSNCKPSIDYPTFKNFAI